MSLVDSSHLTPALNGRHGAHYFLKPRKHDGKLVPSMTLYNTDICLDDKICQNCFRTAFKHETVCPRCGNKL